MYAAHRWDVIPDAEPDDAFTARVIGALATVVADRPDRRVVVVAHGGVIAKAIAIAAGSDRTFAFLADNASISELVHVDGRWILRRFNDTAHLEDRFEEPPRSAQTEASTTDTRGAGPGSTGNVRSRRPSSSAPTTSSDG